MKYSIVGLGKLGASMPAAIASRGFNVIGVDVNQPSVDLLNAGRAPVQETNLDEMIAANKERLLTLSGAIRGIDRNEHKRKQSPPESNHSTQLRRSSDLQPPQLRCLPTSAAIR